MNRIYLATGMNLGAVIVCRDASDIDRDELARRLGPFVELREIGFAHPDTPPGALLTCSAFDVTTIRPLGKKVEDTR